MILGVLPKIHRSGGWVSVLGLTYWSSWGLGWISTGESGYWQGSPHDPSDGITTVYNPIFATATKMRLSYTTVSGTASPVIGDFENGINAFFAGGSSGTYVSEATLTRPIDSNISYIQMDPGDSGVSSVTITNIEIYIP